MLSNLLHLHNSLDPTTDTLSSTSSLLQSSSIAHLLLFTMASVLSHVASTRTPSSPSNHRNKRRRRNRNPNASDYSVVAFRALSTEHIWSLEPPLRDAQWRSLYSLSYPIFTTIVDKLKPHIAVSIFFFFLIFSFLISFKNNRMN